MILARLPVAVKEIGPVIPWKDFIMLSAWMIAAGDDDFAVLIAFNVTLAASYV